MQVKSRDRVVYTANKRHRFSEVDAIEPATDDPSQYLKKQNVPTTTPRPPSKELFFYQFVLFFGFFLFHLKCYFWGLFEQEFIIIYFLSTFTKTIFFCDF